MIRVCHCETCGDRIGPRDVRDPWATAWCSYCGTTVMLLARSVRGGALLPLRRLPVHIAAAGGAR